MAYSGDRWRDLPKWLGDFRAVKRRNCRWTERGALDEALAALIAEANLRWLLLDSTIARGHQSVADARLAKAARRPRPRPLPWRPEHQGSCCGRRAGTGAAADQGRRNDETSQAHALPNGSRLTRSSSIAAMTPITCTTPSSAPMPSQLSCSDTWP